MSDDPISGHPRPAGTASLIRGVGVDMPGRLGPQRTVGGWPNLVEVASLAIGHMNEIADPRFGYLSYVGGGLAQAVPSFSRSFWDWIEASSYALCGRIGARRITGIRTGDDVEIGQRRLTLGSFHNLDGFAHRTYGRGWSEDTSVVLWEEARVLFTLMSWFVESEDDRLLRYVRGILEALLRVSQEEDGHRRFLPPFDDQKIFGDVAAMVLIEPLLKYHEVSGDTDALAFCAGVAAYAASPRSHLVDSDYRTSGSLRALAAGLAGLARFASYTADDRLLTHVERIFRSALSLCTAYGATPDAEPCCTNMELSTVGLALCRAGRGEWWDMIDRHFRNQTLACQLKDPSMVSVGSLPGNPGPLDDTRDIVNRSRGAFSWASAREHNYESPFVMLCCVGNAMWTLGKVVSEAVTLDGQDLSVNLHYSMDTPLASVTHHEPFEGRLEVVPRRSGRLRVRVPAYAGPVEATVDGRPARERRTGSYLTFGEVRGGSSVVLCFEMPERSTSETTRQPPGDRCNAPAKGDPVVKERVNVRWRGNTVMEIDYDEDSPQPKHRLYLERESLWRKGEGRDVKASFFQPDRPYHW